MMDTRSINLLNWLEKHSRLKKVAATNGGEWHGSCPFCGGTDRFIVQPAHSRGGRWLCRQCSPHWQDVIAYIRKFYNVSFGEAITMLGLKPDEMPQKKVLQPPTPPLPAINHASAALADPQWQKAAYNFHMRCLERLHQPLGREALSYLTGRGLSLDTIMHYRLGFNPSNIKMQWGSTQQFLPAGIVIPWHFQGKYWNIRIRRRDQHKSKYTSVKGVTNSLYFGSDIPLLPITPDSIVVLVEGEFDAMSIRQAVNLPNIIPVATGSTSWGRQLCWVVYVAMAKRVLLAFDTDAAGEQAAMWWADQPGINSTRLHPTQPDANEMLILGEDLTQWIEVALG